MDQTTDDEKVITEGMTTEGIPVAPSMGPALASANVTGQSTLVSKRVIFISFLCIVLALVAGLIAQGLVHLIGLITNIAFYGRFSGSFVSPADNHLGYWVIGVPVIGGIIVGFMARYGSKAIRGHGIPEAMEQVLLYESRIPARVTFLKPISAAIAIGTGGPFGAEGPIIATGGALGSLIGQFLKTTSVERKILLAAGAAAGMAATFGSPVSAVILAVELLLFEYRARSLIPVSLAAATAAAVRLSFMGAAPIFPMPNIPQVTLTSLSFYTLLGAIVGVASIFVTKLVYWIEDLFEELPVHWMWWPAIGALAVGLVGVVSPHTMGVGYDNIEKIISGDLTGKVMIVFCLWKLVSWAISLGSGTSGGTLAPLFTIGGGLGVALGIGINAIMPFPAVDLRVAGLVGMAAIFAGASRALLASVVFAFETTHQQLGLLPLLGGCTSSYLISCLGMPNTIMTEKIARRGVTVPADYAADFLEQVRVKDHAEKNVVALSADDTVDAVKNMMETDRKKYSHQGFPVVDRNGALVGVVTRRDFWGESVVGTKKLSEIIKRRPVVVYGDSTLREAADIMTREKIGRLPVVSRENPGKVVGMLSRGDLLSAHQKRLKEAYEAESSIKLKIPLKV